MSLLLHVCCGPCLSGAVTPLQADYGADDLVLFWENPNIHPYREYRERLLSFQQAATAFKLKVLYGDAAYGLQRFISALSCYQGPQRCAICHRLRLEATAAAAARAAIPAFTTTLLISPYQDHELLKKIGQEAADAHGVIFLPTDLRPHFRNTYSESRRLGLYRQSYCGCIFSEFERYASVSKFSLPIPVPALDNEIQPLPSPILPTDSPANSDVDGRQSEKPKDRLP